MIFSHRLPTAWLLSGLIAMVASTATAQERPSPAPKVVAFEDVKFAPPNMAPNALVGRMIAAGQTEAAFLATDTARLLAHEAPDNLTSLTGFFARAPLPETASLLTTISADGPGITETDLHALRLPTLICATAEDHIHPLALAQHLHALIPGSRLVTLPPKGRDKAAHLAALHGAMQDFLKGL